MKEGVECGGLGRNSENHLAKASGMPFGEIILKIVLRDFRIAIVIVSQFKNFQISTHDQEAQNIN